MGTIKKSLFLLCLFLLPLVAGAFTYEPDAQDYDIDQHLTQSFNFTATYEVPSTAIRSEGLYWEVAAGRDTSKPNNFEIENVSVEDYFFNTTHLKLRVEAVSYTDGAGGAGYTKWYAHNSTEYVLLKTTTSSSDPAGAASGSGSVYSYLYDGNFYNQGIYGKTGGTYYYCSYAGCDGVRETASTVREEGLYYDEGTLQDTQFIIIDSLGANIEGVNVSLTRLSDGVFIGTEQTDYSGMVEFELAENYQYQVNASHDDYEDLSVSLTILRTSYIIDLDLALGINESTYFDDVLMRVTDYEVYEGFNSWATVRFHSGAGHLQGYYLNLSVVGDTNETNGIASHGETLNISLYINGSTLGDQAVIRYGYNSSDNAGYVHRSLPVLIRNATPANYTLAGSDAAGGVGLFEGLLLAIAISLLAAGVGVFVGGLIGEPLVPALLLGIIMMSIFTYGVSFVPEKAFWLVAFFGLIIIIARLGDRT